MKSLIIVGVLALLPVPVTAQTPTADLTTPAGHEVNVGAGSYDYVEPDPQRVSMHGPKLAMEYTGTLLISERRHWFVQANARGVLGRITYDGYCSPWLIVPNRTSPNGYALGLGSASACSEDGDADWYLEGRALVGKDFLRWGWGFSPYTGIGFRHLSNGTGGVSGYRTDEYLYLPLGLTARPIRALGLTLEYDRLIRGWQTTRDSAFGGVAVPATATAPAFTIDQFSDVSFAQHRGWALRAGATYRFVKRFSVEPYYIHWSVDDSPSSDIVATFTVNQITAQERIGFFEPQNTTNEFGVKLGFHF